MTREIKNINLTVKSSQTHTEFKYILLHSSRTSHFNGQFHIENHTKRKSLHVKLVYPLCYEFTSNMFFLFLVQPGGRAPNKTNYLSSLKFLTPLASSATRPAIGLGGVGSYSQLTPQPKISQSISHFVTYLKGVVQIYFVTSNMFNK